MRVGILDILAYPAESPIAGLYRLLLTKQFASVTPQAVAVWCRRLGHDTFYATYYGVGDPHTRLPPDLDVLFVACSTRTSPLAYAVSKIYRRAGATTVIGGSHAKSFPTDCQRFFDLVVLECDETLVGEILAGHFDPGTVVSSSAPFDEVPPVEERLPEIHAAAYYRGRQRPPLTAVPMLSSVGCPYNCDFCTDWDQPYRPLSGERLAADLRCVSACLPGAALAFHDPNFAVGFDQVVSVLETMPPGARVPYFIQSSLGVLRTERLDRLRDTRCAFIAPGIESWADYSAKAGAGRTGGATKVDRVAAHCVQIHERVPNIQANFIFGIDTDEGDAPVELTKDFMDRTPFVWSSFNIPVPFGGTPLFDSALKGNRILTAMPFGFYNTPYLVMKLKHYDPITYYERFIELLAHSISPSMLRHRMSSAPSWSVRFALAVRTTAVRTRIGRCREILDALRTDPGFRDFHEGRSNILPEFYHGEYERVTGQYSQLLDRDDRVPVLTSDAAADTSHCHPLAGGVASRRVVT